MGIRQSPLADIHSHAGAWEREKFQDHMRVWNFGYCDLFDICDLLFVI